VRFARNPMEALRDLRVVEIGGDVACAYATKLLADLGADVVKIEPPEGDPLRRWGPFANGRRDPEASGLFRYLNANKRSVVLDLASEGAGGSLLALLRGADVLLESGRPGRLEALGLVESALREASPTLAVVRISPFGQTGPYCDLEPSELVVQAAGGWVTSHGLPSANPVRVGARIPEYLVASYAAAASLTAVRAARDRGDLVHVDVSMMECLLGTLPYPMLWADILKKMNMPPPQKRRTPLPGVLQCKDGWVGVNVLTSQQWSDTCTLFEVPQFVPHQQDIHSNRPVTGEFFAAIQPWLDEHTADEIVTLGQAFRIPTVWVGNGETLRQFEQLRERSFFVSDPGGSFERPGFPYRLARTPASLRKPAPRLGADTESTRAKPWPDREKPKSAIGPTRPTAREVADLPYRDLRVLDLGTFWAGPLFGMYFASHGADVIKIESVQRPDGFRFSQTFTQLGEDYYEHSATYQGTNQGKRGLTLDLRKDAARELFFRLLATTDILIENFSPRVMENFGLSYERLREVKPDLIQIRMPGFGLEGPWRDYVGWATVIEQATGMTWVTGHPDGPPLNPGGFIDCAVSMHAGTALQAALLHRERTGEGQLIELAQLETGACLTAEQVIEHSLNGRVQDRHGNRDPDVAPQGAYPCRDDRWIALTVRDDAEWKRFVEALGSPAWATEPALARLEERLRRHDEIDEHLSAWTRERSSEDVVAALRERRIPVSEALVATRMYGEPHLEARGYYQAIVHPRSGERRYPVWPVRFSFGPAQHYRGPAPTLGQHNREILCGELGLSAGDFARLEREQIVGEKMAR